MYVVNIYIDTDKGPLFMRELVKVPNEFLAEKHVDRYNGQQGHRKYKDGYTWLITPGKMYAMYDIAEEVI